MVPVFKALNVSIMFQILFSFHQSDVWTDVRHVLPAASEHRDGGQPGHDGLNQLVHPLGQAGELAGLRANHFDQLRHLAAADRAELEQGLHAAPDFLLVWLTLEQRYLEPRPYLVLNKLPGRIVKLPSPARSRRHQKPRIWANEFC